MYRKISEILIDTAETRHKTGTIPENCSLTCLQSYFLTVETSGTKILNPHREHEKGEQIKQLQQRCIYFLHAG